MDLIIGILAVVGWLVAQSVGKRGKASPPPVPPASGKSHDPDDDLRKFFENLERGLTGQLNRPAPPIRAEAHPPPLQQPLERQPSRPEPFDPEQVTVPSVAPVVDLAPAFTLSTAEAAERWKAPPLHPLAAGFTDAGKLGQMIVATEVLGPPLALRQARTTFF